MVLILENAPRLPPLTLELFKAKFVADGGQGT